MQVQTQASTIKSRASSLVSNFFGNKSSSNNPATVTKKLDLSQPIPVNSKLAATDSTPFTNNLTKLSVDRIKNYRLLYPLSWKPTLNPHATTASKVIGDWLKELTIVKDEQTLKIFEEERADLYGGYPFPFTCLERYTPIAKALVLWILFDDLVIENSQNYWERNNLSIDDYFIALSDGYLSPNADPFLHAWWELGESFGAEMSQGWRNLFATEYIDWARESIREYQLHTKIAKSGRLPDLNTYIDLRTYSIGMKPAYYLIEYGEGFELPNQVRNHPIMSALRELATKIVYLGNDIIGLEKDIVAEWPNIVTVIQQEYGITLSEAVHRAVDMHNECVFDFVDLESKLPSFGNEIDPFIHSYLQGVKFMSRGFMEFTAGAERYQWKSKLAPGKVPFKVSIASFVNN